MIEKRRPFISTTNTKRPKWVILIAIWMYYQSPFFIGTPLRIIENYTGIPHNIIEFTHASLAWIVIVFLIVGFINLRQMPRQIVLGLLTIATLSIAYDFFDGIKLINNQIIPHTTRSYILYSAMLFINISCIYLLLRSKFIELAKKYREEIVELNKKQRATNQPIEGDGKNRGDADASSI